MLQVKVCVGSSCHVRGGAKTLRLFKSLIDAHELADKVSLEADLCLENCMRAPNVVIDGAVHGGVTPDVAEDFFRQNIMNRVNQHADSGDNNH